MLIHIGYPKTGSTWLQADLFASERAGFWSPWTDEARREFLDSNPYRFSPERARARFAPGIEEAKRRGLVPVITDEWLAGNQVTADYRGRYVADSLRAAFPEARILIVIREQRAMLLSSYREFVLCGGALTLTEFLGIGAKHANFEPHCRLDHLEYDLAIAHYHALFGRESVMVEPFERMVADPRELHRRVAAFAGARGSYDAAAPPNNVGLRGSVLFARRLLNNLDQPFTFHFDRALLARRIIASASSLTAKVAPTALDRRLEAELKETLESSIGTAYVESNRRTSALADVNLGALGYQV